MAWRKADKHSVWKWSHADPQMGALGQQRMLGLKAASVGKRSAVDWTTLEVAEGGFTLKWREPVGHDAAHRWAWGYMQREGEVATGKKAGHSAARKP